MNLAPEFNQFLGVSNRIIPKPGQCKQSMIFKKRKLVYICLKNFRIICFSDNPRSYNPVQSVYCCCMIINTKWKIQKAKENSKSWDIGFDFKSRLNLSVI